MLTPDQDQNAYRVYGRRRGKRMTAEHERMLVEVLPRYGVSIDAPTAAFAEPDRPFWLEVGFGGGEHLLHQARNRPEVNFLGCEPFFEGVARALEDVTEHDIRNVRLFPDDARKVIDVLPDGSVDRLFILFPDPWRKTRHHKRRFIGPENLPRLSRILADGAEFRAFTDHQDYGRWILWHVTRHPDFEWMAEEADDWLVPPGDYVATRYEQKAREQGRKPVYFRFRRRPRG